MRLPFLRNRNRRPEQEFERGYRPSYNPSAVEGGCLAVWLAAETVKEEDRDDDIAVGNRMYHWLSENRVGSRDRNDIVHDLKKKTEQRYPEFFDVPDITDDEAENDITVKMPQHDHDYET